jgi:battenin
MPPIPKRLLSIPAALQGVILTLLSLQASHYIFSTADARPHPSASGGAEGGWWNRVFGWLLGKGSASEATTFRKHITDRAITVVFLLICLEGLMGGLGYCHTFYHIGHDGDDEPVQEYSRLAQVGDDHLSDDIVALEALARRKAVKEFRMGAAGAADSLGKSGSTTVETRL